MIWPRVPPIPHLDHLDNEIWNFFQRVICRWGLDWGLILAWLKTLYPRWDRVNVFCTWENMNFGVPGVGLYWVEQCPPATLRNILCPPGTCEHDLIWKQGLRRCDEVNMRSHWNRAVPAPSVLIGRRKFEQGHTRGIKHGKPEAEIGVILSWTKGHQRLPTTTRNQRVREQSIQKAPTRSLTSDFWPSELWENKFMF